MKNVDLRKYFNLCAAFGKRCKSYEQGKDVFFYVYFILTHFTHSLHAKYGFAIAKHDY